MKPLTLWIVVAAWLLAAEYLHLSQQQQAVELPRGAVPLEQSRVVPYDKPAQLHPAAAVHTSKFGGYPCSSHDCAEDKAGYRWAVRNGISDPDDCTGNTGGFIDGCRVYARQRVNYSGTLDAIRPAGDTDRG